METQDGYASWCCYKQWFPWAEAVLVVVRSQAGGGAATTIATASSGANLPILL